uniref:Putative GTP-binding protein 6 n=1 Tax=Phallusia mammillata TaxID=59560 RepID=A0A6F9DE54_9ASCI|nr:putative GTP-binding protein 6 [Phallusia mammillata]
MNFRLAHKVLSSSIQALSCLRTILLRSNKFSVSCVHHQKFENEQRKSVLGVFTSEDEKYFHKSQQVFILQPYNMIDGETVKKAKLDESIALVESIPGWKPTGNHFVELRSGDINELLGKNTLSQTVTKINEVPSVSCVFVSTKQFSVQHKAALINASATRYVCDRQELVLYIFYLRAQSKFAQLQVTLAALPQIQQNIYADPYKYMAFKGCSGESFMERIAREFKTKEQKLQRQLKKLKKEREVVSSVRKSSGVPTVAIVGYTNAGKTSLVQILSRTGRAKPKDELFSTLDVTAHSAVLPNQLNYVLIDSVGFLSDIPKGLINAFTAIMEDMLQADLIIHVRDMSHPDCKGQLKSVLSFLLSMGLRETLLNNIVEVRNKVDLTDRSLSTFQFDKPTEPKRPKAESSTKCIIPVVICYTSITRNLGIDTLLSQVEKQLMRVTNRREVKFDIPSHGLHLKWLASECSVQNIQAVTDHRLCVTVVAVDWKIKKFLSVFPDSKQIET